MILGLQASIHGLRRKQTKDIIQLHIISNPASHLQRGPTKQSKPTNEAPAPTYTREGPLTRHAANDGDQAAEWGRLNPRFSRTWTGSRPAQLRKEDCHRHPNVGCQCSRAFLTQVPTSPHYIRGLHTPSQVIHNFHSFHKEKE